MCDDNATMLAGSCRVDRARLASGKPTRRRASAEERKRRGSTASPGHRTGLRCSVSDDMVPMKLSPFGERYYVFSGNGVFVVKTNVDKGLVLVGGRAGAHSPREHPRPHPTPDASPTTESTNASAMTANSNSNQMLHTLFH